MAAGEARSEGEGAPAGRSERIAFAVAVATLLGAHMLGVPQGDAPLILGWVPRDLAYRVVWMLAGAGVVFWMSARLWPNRN